MDSDLGEILQNLDNTVRELNSIYREIIMITGTNPDANRDYRIENSIPDLLPRLEELSGRLSVIYDDMILSGFKEGGEIVVIRNTLRFLESIIEQPFTIPNRLQALVGNTGGISALITTLT